VFHRDLVKVTLLILNVFEHEKSSALLLLLILTGCIHDIAGCQTGCQTFDNRLNVCIHDTTGCETGLTTGLTTGCIV